VVIDSADDPDIVETLDEHLPTGVSGSILITSRNTSLVGKYGGMVLSTLDEANAVQLLLESIKRQGWKDTGDATRTTAAATNVVRRLGCFPLAITEAAHYISSSGETGLWQFISDYEQNELAPTDALADVQQQEQQQQQGPRGEDQPFKRSILWSMSYSSLSPDQQRLLTTISFFDPTRIPLELISDGAAQARGTGSESLNFLKNEVRFQACKSALIASSLVMQNENFVWIHQLSQESAQASMTVQERQGSWDRAVCLLDAMWPVADRSKRRRTDLWPDQMKYLPHIESLAYWFRFYDVTEHPLQVDGRFAQLLIQGAR
jgi:hypothetical protein